MVHRGAPPITLPMDFPQRLQHRAPTWVRDGDLFHVRLRVDAAQKRKLTENELAEELLEAAKRYHDLGHWWCELFLLMPDHLHALLRFPPEPGMSTVVRNWKRGTARFQKIVWQSNFFDHRIRDRFEADEKWRYIRLNPVVKNLCTAEHEWPSVWGQAGGTR